MKTGALRKKILKLWPRANSETQDSLIKIFEVEANKIPNAIETADRLTLERVMELLAPCVGPATQKSQAQLTEEKLLLKAQLDAVDYWNEHFGWLKALPTNKTDDRLLQDLTEADFDDLASQCGASNWQELLNHAQQWADSPDRFGFEQGQIRPDPNLGRWDLWAYMFGESDWNLAAGLITGIAEKEFKLQQEMNEYCVDTPEELAKIKEFDQLLETLTAKEIGILIAVMELKARQVSEKLTLAQFELEFNELFPEELDKLTAACLLLHPLMISI